MMPAAEPTSTSLRRPARCALCTLCAGLLFLGGLPGTLPAATSSELPKRKPGLWELDTRMEGMPSLGTLQQCIDRSTDDLLNRQANKERHNCSVLEVKTDGKRATIHAVCKLQDSTVTTDASFVGSFDVAYKGEMQTRFSPPLHGISESRASIDARWIGPCKAGQKPGDVIMPGMGSMNLNEMIKDPRIQEMIKQR